MGLLFVLCLAIFGTALSFGESYTSITGLKSLQTVSSNSNCTGAEEISLGSTSFSTSDAISTSYSANCGSFSYVLWYKYTANFTGYLQYSTCNSATYNTVIYVYQSCSDFPSGYSDCNNDYCGTTSLLNAGVTAGQSYFIAIGSADNSTGTGTLKLSQANLQLFGFASGISLSGGSVSYTVQTSATNIFDVIVNITCTSGSSPILDIVSADGTTRFISVSARSAGTCIMIAYDPEAPGLVSNSYTFYVGGELTISSPVNNIVNGPPFNLTVETPSDPTLSLAVNATIVCASGSQMFEVRTNSRTVVALTNELMYGSCKISAVTNPVAFTSYFPNSLEVYLPSTITSPANGLVWPVNEPLSLLVSSYASATGLGVFIFFFCSQFAFAYVNLNEALLYTFSPTLGSSVCTAYAAGNFISVSPTITFTLQTPLSLSANLNGWEGGSTVNVTIVPYNAALFNLQFNINCPVSSQSFNISTNTPQALELNSDLSGIGCVLTTSNLPDYYIPITPTSVNINLSPEAQKAIVQVLQPSSFIKPAKPEQSEDTRLMRDLRPCKVPKVSFIITEKSVVYFDKLCNKSSTF